MDDQSTKQNFLTIEELSDRLPLSISTIRRRIRDGKIPSIQLAGRRSKHLIPARFVDDLTRQLTTSRSRNSQSDQSKSSIPGPKPRWMTRSKRRNP